MCKSTSFRQPEKLCGKHKIPIEITYESPDEGYYAVRIELIDKRSYDRYQKCQNRNSNNTQVQEVIRKLLHYYYEQKRIETRNYDTNWKWNYKSDLFSSSYLGHILHYVEGLILEVRDKQVGFLPTLGMLEISYQMGRITGKKGERYPWRHIAKPSSLA